MLGRTFGSHSHLGVAVRGPRPSPGRRRTVVFDFDGTLADTRAAVLRTVLETTTTLGWPPIDPAEVAARIGLPLAELFRLAGREDVRELHEAVRTYRAHFDRFAKSVRVFEGLASLLEDLRNDGMRLAVASSRGGASLRGLIDRLGLAGYFDIVVSEEDVVEKKPSPEALWTIARALGVEPEDMLVVGDTEYDVRMGRNAGAATCAVTWGIHDRARLERTGPRFLVHDVPSARRAIQLWRRG